MTESELIALLVQTLQRAYQQLVIADPNAPVLDEIFKLSFLPEVNKWLQSK